MWLEVKSCKYYYICFCILLLFDDEKLDNPKCIHSTYTQYLSMKYKQFKRVVPMELDASSSQVNQPLDFRVFSVEGCPFKLDTV
jgi:hypothetical protein